MSDRFCPRQKIAKGPAEIQCRSMKARREMIPRPQLAITVAEKGKSTALGIYRGECKESSVYISRLESHLSASCWKPSGPLTKMVGLRVRPQEPLLHGVSLAGAHWLSLTLGEYLSGLS